jgi:hypothetical protein
MRRATANHDSPSEATILARLLAEGGEIPADRTAVGRVTVAVLNMNDPFRVALREGLILQGRFPPA